MKIVSELTGVKSLGEDWLECAEPERDLIKRANDRGILSVIDVSHVRK